MKSVILASILISLFCLNGNAGNEYKTQGITSAIQSKHVNQIVFAPASSAIAFQNENESEFRSEYTYGEEIYFRVYLDNSLSNYLIKELPGTAPSVISKNAFYIAYFFLDDKPISSSTISSELQESHKNEWTTFKGAFDNGDNGGDPILRGAYWQFLTEADNALTNGKHKIRVEIRAGIDTPIKHETKTVATGEIMLTVLPTSITKYDENLCLEKAVMSIPALEANVMKKYASMPENSKTVKEARITSDWTIVRNEYTSVILRRELTLLVISLNKEGKYVYKSCYISQEYIGGKFQDTFSYRDDAYENRVSSRCFTK